MPEDKISIKFLGKYHCSKIFLIEDSMHDDFVCRAFREEVFLNFQKPENFHGFVFVLHIFSADLSNGFR